MVKIGTVQEQLRRKYYRGAKWVLGISLCSFIIAACMKKYSIYNVIMYLYIGIFMAALGIFLFINGRKKISVYNYINVGETSIDRISQKIHSTPDNTEKIINKLLADRFLIDLYIDIPSKQIVYKSNRYAEPVNPVINPQPNIMPQQIPYTNPYNANNGDGNAPRQNIQQAPHPTPPPPPAERFVVCPNCRATTSDRMGICEYCGVSLNK